MSTEDVKVEAVAVAENENSNDNSNNVQINLTVVNKDSDDKGDKQKCVSCDKEFDDVSGLKGHIRRGSCAGMEDEKDPIEAHLEHALAQLEKIVGDDEIKPANVLLFALHLEQVVEKYDNLEGPQRKVLVLKAFKEYMDKHGGNKYNALEYLPAFIDVSVSLDKGETTIKVDTEDVVERCAGLLALCANSAKKAKKKN